MTYRILCRDCGLEAERNQQDSAWRVRRAHARSSGHDVVLEEVDN